MRKEEIELLLSKSGFTVSLNRRIGQTPMTHMIHVGPRPMWLVEYTFDELKDTIKTIWGYTGQTLRLIETLTDLETWLGE
jgi:hypothetical protein